jgi:predicted GNAT family acetyltransferase
MTSDPAVGISVVDVPHRSRFEIRVDGEIAGFAAYHRRPGVIAFMHTEIDPRFGKGLASKLIHAALSEARSEGASVLPFCPFVRGYIARHGEYLDLVPNEMRASFQLSSRV